jgi:hypothetical protein
MRTVAFGFVILMFPLFAVAAVSCGGGESTTSGLTPVPGTGTPSGDAAPDAKDGSFDASAGAAGAAGSSGASGSGGQAGSAGESGQGGSSGQDAGDDAGDAEQGGAAGDGASDDAGDAGQGGAAGDDAGIDASAGNAGSAGAAGSAGSAGSAGTAGSAGSAGNAGTAGSAGSAPDAGDAGQTPKPCTVNADCPNGSTCQISPNAGNTALELTCHPIVGSNDTGYPCTDNALCRSGLCLLGYCSAPCSGAADCTQAGTCKQQPVTIGGLSGSFDLCVVAPCSNTLDCDPGEVCSAIQYGTNEVYAFCRQGQSSGGDLGADCTAPAGCKSLLCPAWFGTCTEVCSADAECSAMAGGICVDMAVWGTTSVQVCADACSKASDCGGTKNCVLTSDSKGDQYRFVCGPGGTDPTGTDCSTTIHCASGLCLTNYSGGQKVDSICTQPCVTAADCPVGYGVCANVQMTRPSGTGTQIISACNHP